jgi:hypothetical protein
MTILSYIYKKGKSMQEFKAFNLRMPREIWVFLRKQSIVQEKAMNAIILGLIEKYKKSLEKKLTSDDMVV